MEKFVRALERRGFQDLTKESDAKFIRSVAKALNMQYSELQRRFLDTYVSARILVKKVPPEPNILKQTFKLQEACWPEDDAYSKRRSIAGEVDMVRYDLITLNGQRYFAAIIERPHEDMS